MDQNNCVCKQDPQDVCVALTRNVCPDEDAKTLTITYTVTNNCCKRSQTAFESVRICDLILIGHHVVNSENIIGSVSCCNGDFWVNLGEDGVLSCGESRTCIVTVPLGACCLPCLKKLRASAYFMGQPCQTYIARSNLEQE